MMLKFLSCLLLSSLTVTICFLLGYLGIWVYEKLTGSSAGYDVLVAYVSLVTILAVCLTVS